MNVKMEEVIKKKKNKPQPMKYNSSTTWHQLKDKNVIYFCNCIGVYADKFYCHLCQQTLISLERVHSHLENSEHGLKRQEKPEIAQINALHFATYRYKTLINNNIFFHCQSTVKSLMFDCKICECIINGEKKIQDHISSSEHTAAKMEFNKKYMNKENINSNNQKTSKPEERKILSLNKCTNESKNDAVVDQKSNNDDKLTEKKKVPLQKNKKKTRKSIQKFQKLNKAEYEEVICEICGCKVHNYVQLHAHLTSHYWSKFGLDFEQLIAEESLKIKETLCLDEILSGNLPTIDEESDEISTNDANSEEKKSEDTSSSKSSDLNSIKITDEIQQEKKENKKRNMPQNIKRMLVDVDVEDKKSGINIYDMDEKRYEDIRLSISFICMKSKKNYCLICRTYVDQSKINIVDHIRSKNHCYYLELMREDDEAFQTFPENWSDLTLAMDYMEDVSDYHIYCHACELGIENDTGLITLHMRTELHVQNCALIQAKRRVLDETLMENLKPPDWYCVQRYWCVPCKRRDYLEVAFIEHLQSYRHQKTCNSYVSRGQRLAFDYCSTCAAIFYGFPVTFAYHSECKMHKHHALDKFFVISKLPEASRRLLTAPNAIIQKIMADTTRNSASAALQDSRIIADMESAVRNKFPEVKAHLFGSRLTNLSNVTSDLDIFVDCGNAYNCTKATSKIQKYLKDVEECLKDQSEVWTIARTVLHCKVPIIRAYHKPTGTECDFSFSNGLSVENSKLLKDYVDNFPMCRQLILFMKLWFENCDFIKIHRICSYVLAWLVIYYLQNRKIVPTIAELILQGNSVDFGHWKRPVMGKIKPSISDCYDFIDLLRGFFEFYSQFDYHHEVICPLIGASVPKLTFLEPNQLPESMQRYIDYIESNETPKYFRIDSPMCIQDPLELSENISGGVNKFILYRFRKFCSLSTEML